MLQHSSFDWHVFMWTFPETVDEADNAREKSQQEYNRNCAQLAWLTFS